MYRQKPSFRLFVWAKIQASKDDHSIFNTDHLNECAKRFRDANKYISGQYTHLQGVLCLTKKNMS